MDLKTILALVLAFIMFALGLGLTIKDFTRVFQMPKGIGMGLLNQIILLPIVAFILIMIFGLQTELAVGFMLLAAAPGGPTSNMLTSLARGNVAMSVSMTAIVSLLSMLTVPLVLAGSMAYFMGADAPSISAVSIAMTMFIITVVPLSIGMAVKAFAGSIAGRIENTCSLVAMILFTIVILGALATNWAVFSDNVLKLGPALVSLNIIMLVLGMLTAGYIGLNLRDASTISIESGVQNGTLAITVAALLVTSDSVFSAYAIPAAVYGVIMYMLTVPFVIWRRGMTED